MSGFLPTDEVETSESDHAERCPVTVTEGAIAKVGAFDVVRVLPRRARRTVGPWCFVDHMGPGSVSADHGLDVAPHPHIGLQTVTWLFDGAILHRDSLGSEQLITPGQLNLMTAGRGVSHSEETVGFYDGPLHGVQFWVALDADGREVDPAFEHHDALPIAEFDQATATVLLGGLGDVTSPARRDTTAIGTEVQLRTGTAELPLDPSFEHAVVVIDGGNVVIDDTPVPHNTLAYLGIGRDVVRLTVDGPTRAMLVGGRPRQEPLVMWWNYVAPTRAEIVQAHADWTEGADRFGTVNSPLPRLIVEGPPWAQV